MKNNPWQSTPARIYYIVGTLFYLYKFLFALGFAGIGISIIEYFRSQSSLIIGFTALVSLNLLGWGILAWIRSHEVQLQCANPGLELLEEEIEYSLKGHDEYEYIKHAKVKALYNGVESYKKKLRWSGKGKVFPLSSNPQNKIECYEEKDGPYLICRVSFDRALKKSEIRDFGYRLKLSDTKRTAKPYYIIVMNDKCRKAILKISFPSHDRIKEFKKQIFTAYKATIPIFEESITISPNKNEFCWKIDNPKLGYIYKVIWLIDSNNLHV